MSLKDDQTAEDDSGHIPEKLIIGSPYLAFTQKFTELPWGKRLDDWAAICPYLEQLPHGLSRHPVVFVNLDGDLFALKELPYELAEKEYQLLQEIANLRLPVVSAVGYATIHKSKWQSSVLITRYLDRSLPYRSIFIRSGLLRYQESLLDAIAGLLVQLHLAGVYWGDCSLSNTLFRRDAGTLQAYLVDAETAEIYAPRLDPTLRYHDLEIMEENISGDIADLVISKELDAEQAKLPIRQVGSYIRERYRQLWEEITRELSVSPNESYRIQERVRALNALGFSVGNIEMQPTDEGGQVRLRFMVTDRNFHRDQLMGLTGISAEEMQARQMMNEIQEFKASLSHTHQRSTPLSVAAYRWLEDIYLPALQQLSPILASRESQGEALSQTELYCQVLEHKWYLSERARRDVGHQTAIQNYLDQIWNQSRDLAET